MCAVYSAFKFDDYGLVTSQNELSSSFQSSLIPRLFGFFLLVQPVVPENQVFYEATGIERPQPRGISLIAIDVHEPESLACGVLRGTGVKHRQAPYFRLLLSIPLAHPGNQHFDLQ